MATPELLPIPQPKPHFLLGNSPEIDPATPSLSMLRLSREYGPIFRLKFPAQEMIVVSSQELVNELCDETRFDKMVHQAIENARVTSGDGLFTARTEEPNWGKAHRILMPAFGPAAMRNMFEPMWDIAEQLLLRWERHGDERIDLADNMTRLTLDTIALWAFSYRFNSFYSDTPHPFIQAMVRGLLEAGAAARRPAIMTRLMFLKARQRQEDKRTLHNTADTVIAQRKKLGAKAGTHDLLDLMLSGKDPKTGEGLSDENIRFQLVTFLIAGHETTSGLLTFAFYLLLKNPETLAKARAEVDRVLGTELPRFDHLMQLGYIDQVLKETLRLWPTAPGFAVHCYEPETVIGGKYRIHHNETIQITLPALHRDPKVWGPDPERFDPDRFAPEAFAKLPPNSWKAFGNGQRACIGRPFALQEAQLLLASVLQRFDVSMADPGYQLKVKQALTMKPEGFFIKVKRRNVALTRTAAAAPAATAAAASAPPAAATVPLRVLFGSNSGSAEAFAQRIATDARAHGFVSTIGTLDDATGHLPKEGAVVIVTASYEGNPTDNARKFVTWMETLGTDALKGVKYGVFGCGNKDWARTYQKVPKRIDEKLKEAGAQRLVERGEADARGDFFGDFDRWYASFWPTLAKAFGQEARDVAPVVNLEMEFVESARDPILRQNNLQRGDIVENHELVAHLTPGAPSKRHIEIALPSGSKYRAGDYLSVLASNPFENVARALRRFGLAYDAQVVLKPTAGMQTFFPVGHPVLAGELLASFVELAAPATRQQIEKLAIATSNPAEKQALEKYVQDADAYTKELLEKRVSVLDLLERYGSCDLPFAALLQMLTPLKPRQYSISSSPRWSAEHCTITVAVLNAPAWSGQGVYHGVASTYLDLARPGMKVAVSTRPSQAAFHLPDDLETPIIMVGAGTGIAPFRGFLQERAIRVAEEHVPALGAALLFFGCHHPDQDFLYKEELTAWEQEGIVKIRSAFSGAPDGEVKYVQHRLWHDRAEVMDLMSKGARIYVCGDGKHMAPSVRETFGRMYQELNRCTAEDVENWLAELEKSIRYSQDVFA